MRLYRPCIVEDCSYDGQATKCAQQRPRSSQNVADILRLLLSVSKEARYECWEAVQWGCRYASVDVFVNIEIPCLSMV